MDVDHVPAGVDFVDYLNRQVAACDVFLAVIGPNWVDAKDDSGHRRFDNPNDYVTVEIAAALARNIRVIPVLVDGARTPNADKLPDSIKLLVRRNAVEVRNTHFGRDAEALTNKVREALKTTRPVTRRWPFMASAAASLMVALSATVLLLGWLGLYQMGVSVWMPWTPRAEQPDPPRVADNSKVAAEAEAQRKAEQAEQERAAAAKAEENRKAKAAAEAKERSRAAEAEAQAAYSAAVASWGGNYTWAIAAASEAIRVDPKNANALSIRGLAYANMGDNDRAIADFSEAIRLDPKFATAFHNRGIAYEWKGDKGRAVADYSEAIRLDPKHAASFCSRGRAKLKDGDVLGGNYDIRKAKELDSSSCQ
jgi:tetratricopeptide (TPR) repeat protein